MLTGFPKVTVSSQQQAEINIEDETKNGAVIVTQFPIAKKVILEPQAVFRIIKHANDFGNRLAAGKLTGMQFGENIEISCAVPEFQPSYDASLGAEEAQQRRLDAEAGDLQHIAHLSKEGFDGFIVGRYISSSHSALNEFNVKQLAEAMMDVPTKKSSKKAAKEARPALLLVFDYPKTCMGKLHLRAFVPTPEYAEYSKITGATVEDFVRSDVKNAGVVAEVPVEIQVSPLAELLFTQHLAARPRNVQNKIVAEGDLGMYKERGVAQISDFQREIRMTSEAIQRNRINLNAGDNAMKTELLFERIRDQASYLANLEIGCVTNVDFVRTMKEHQK